jgi:hypothetical protein
MVSPWPPVYEYSDVISGTHIFIIASSSLSAAGLSACRSFLPALPFLRFTFMEKNLCPSIRASRTAGQGVAGEAEHGSNKRNLSEPFFPF